ncbi:MAG: response regulator [Planctomycetota bacterium]
MRQVVWMIDDCPLTLKIAKVRLRSLGAEIYAMPSGREAFGAWMNGSAPRPSVILVNPDVHSGDGLAACKMLRDAGCSNPIHLLADPTGADIGPETASAFVDGILVKPVSTDSFASMLSATAARLFKPAA